MSTGHEDIIVVELTDKVPDQGPLFEELDAAQLHLPTSVSLLTEWHSHQWDLIVNRLKQSRNAQKCQAAKEKLVGQTHGSPRQVGENKAGAVQLI